MVRNLDGKSNLEATFDHRWHAFAPPDLSDPVTQHRFYPERKWRWDRAWPDHMLAVELDGAGGGGYGRLVYCLTCGDVVRAKRGDGSPGKKLLVPYPSHASGGQSKRDAEKQNAGVELGWRVLRYTAVQLAEEPDRVVEQIVRILRQNLENEK